MKNQSRRRDRRQTIDRGESVDVMATRIAPRQSSSDDASDAQHSTSSANTLANFLADSNGQTGQTYSETTEKLARIRQQNEEASAAINALNQFIFVAGHTYKGRKLNLHDQLRLREAAEQVGLSLDVVDALVEQTSDPDSVLRYCFASDDAFAKKMKSDPHLCRLLEEGKKQSSGSGFDVADSVWRIFMHKIVQQFLRNHNMKPKDVISKDTLTGRLYEEAIRNERKAYENEYRDDHPERAQGQRDYTRERENLRITEDDARIARQKAEANTKFPMHRSFVGQLIDDSETYYVSDRHSIGTDDVLSLRPGVYADEGDSLVRKGAELTDGESRKEVETKVGRRLSAPAPRISPRTELPADEDEEQVSAVKRGLAMFEKQQASSKDTPSSQRRKSLDELKQTRMVALRAFESKLIEQSGSQQKSGQNHQRESIAVLKESNVLNSRIRLQRGVSNGSEPKNEPGIHGPGTKENAPNIIKLNPYMTQQFEISLSCHKPDDSQGADIVQHSTRGVLVRAAKEKFEVKHGGLSVGESEPRRPERTRRENVTSAEEVPAETVAQHCSTSLHRIQRIAPPLHASEIGTPEGIILIGNCDDSNGVCSSITLSSSSSEENVHQHVSVKVRGQQPRRKIRRPADSSIEKQDLNERFLEDASTDMRQGTMSHNYPSSNLKGSISADANPNWNQDRPHPAVVVSSLYSQKSSHRRNEIHCDFSNQAPPTPGLRRQGAEEGRGTVCIDEIGSWVDFEPSFINVPGRKSYGDRSGKGLSENESASARKPSMPRHISNLASPPGVATDDYGKNTGANQKAATNNLKRNSTTHVHPGNQTSKPEKAQPNGQTPVDPRLSDWTDFQQNPFKYASRSEDNEKSEDMTSQQHFGDSKENSFKFSNRNEEQDISIKNTNQLDDEDTSCHYEPQIVWQAHNPIPTSLSLSEGRHVPHEIGEPVDDMQQCSRSLVSTTQRVDPFKRPVYSKRRERTREKERANETYPANRLAGLDQSPRQPQYVSATSDLKGGMFDRFAEEGQNRSGQTQHYLYTGLAETHGHTETTTSMSSESDFELFNQYNESDRERIETIQASELRACSNSRHSPHTDRSQQQPQGPLVSKQGARASDVMPRSRTKNGALADSISMHEPGPASHLMLDSFPTPSIPSNLDSAFYKTTFLEENDENNTQNSLLSCQGQTMKPLGECRNADHVNCEVDPNRVITIGGVTILETSYQPMNGGPPTTSPIFNSSPQHDEDSFDYSNQSAPLRTSLGAAVDTAGGGYYQTRKHHEFQSAPTSYERHSLGQEHQVRTEPLAGNSVSRPSFSTGPTPRAGSASYMNNGAFVDQEQHPWRARAGERESESITDIHENRYLDNGDFDNPDDGPTSPTQLRSADSESTVDEEDIRLAAERQGISPDVVEMMLSQTSSKIRRAPLKGRQHITPVHCQQHQEAPIDSDTCRPASTRHLRKDVGPDACDPDASWDEIVNENGEFIEQYHHRAPDCPPQDPSPSQAQAVLAALQESANDAYQNRRASLQSVPGMPELPEGATEEELNLLNRFIEVASCNFDGKKLSAESEKRVRAAAVKVGLSEKFVDQLLEQANANNEAQKALNSGIPVPTVGVPSSPVFDDQSTYFTHDNMTQTTRTTIKRPRRRRKRQPGTACNDCNAWEPVEYMSNLVRGWVNCGTTADVHPSDDDEEYDDGASSISSDGYTADLSKRLRRSQRKKRKNSGKESARRQEV